MPFLFRRNTLNQTISFTAISCRPSIKIPAFVMMPIAYVVELIYKLLGPYGMKVPQLTPSRVRLLSCSRTFDCTKAKDRLGYAPVVPLQVIHYLICKEVYLFHLCTIATVSGCTVWLYIIIYNA